MLDASVQSNPSAPEGLTALIGRDPIYDPPKTKTAFFAWAEELIHDPRDVPFVREIILQTAVMFPAIVLMYALFQWWMAPLYLALVYFGFVDRYILMLHNTSHRPLFKKRYRRLNLYIPWVLGPIFGETPNTYYAHHLGMHHPEENLPKDLSSTMPYQRDNVLHFAVYFFRFFFLVMVELAMYLARNKRYRLIRRMLVGEWTFYAFVVAMCFVNLEATLVVFVAPVIITRFLMMAGNWAQHAFVDPAAPESAYLSSITCIDTRYNRRAWNDGYHIGHHLKGNRHWTELPIEFYENRAKYAAEGAIVFRKIDFFIVWFFLMLRRYDWLAKYYVDLTGTNPDEATIIRKLKARTKAFRSLPSRSVSAPVRM